MGKTITEKIDAFGEKMDKWEEKSLAKGTYNHQETQEKTRASIAKGFVFRYFLILGGSIMLVLAYNIFVLWYFNTYLDCISGCNYDGYLIALNEYIPIISSIVVGPLGFVVGYYFKTSEK